MKNVCLSTEVIEANEMCLQLSHKSMKTAQENLETSQKEKQELKEELHQAKQTNDETHQKLEEAECYHTLNNAKMSADVAMAMKNCEELENINRLLQTRTHGLKWRRLLKMLKIRQALCKALWRRHLWRPKRNLRLQKTRQNFTKKCRGAKRLQPACTRE